MDLEEGEGEEGLRGSVVGGGSFFLLPLLEREDCLLRSRCIAPIAPIQKEPLLVVDSFLCGLESVIMERVELLLERVKGERPGRGRLLIARVGPRDTSGRKAELSLAVDLMLCI